jgi:hypothetical protein
LNLSIFGLLLGVFPVCGSVWKNRQLDRWKQVVVINVRIDRFPAILKEAILQKSFSLLELVRLFISSPFESRNGRPKGSARLAVRDND